ncbi:MAG: ferritin-like domain-containing protein [Alphaproteobacteria bacterium]|nr:ferritin-like domain-containing protein [Alphaproteobacteria bacterium]
MGSWTLEDIAWDRFEPRKVDPGLVAIVKAASLVEHNGADYAQYLCKVFEGDAAFQEVARRWGAEEIQHGDALGRWAALADPTFDFSAACRRFSAGFRLDLDAARSVRGSRSGELIARCVVETGTSSYYTALAEATQEPVLRQICQRIAADEFRHYKLFYATLQRYRATEKLGFLRRLRIAAGRIAETEDDELAYAYHAANDGAAPYDRRRCSAAYARRAFAVYRPHHVERGMAMVFKAVGLTPNGRINRIATRAACWVLRRRQARLARSGERVSAIS